MWRRVILGGGVGALFIGCLFPSFDELKNNDIQRPNADDDDETDASKTRDANVSSSGATSGTTSGQTSTSSGTVADTGTDTAQQQKKTINCDGKICDVDTTFCCDEGFGNTSCRPKGAGCSPWTFECDDSTDCPAGQLCCHAGGLLVKCDTSCGGGDEICQPGKPCKNGTCGGDLVGPPAVTVHECK